MKARQHVVSTISVFGRDQLRARCRCGWKGLPRTGPSAEEFAGNDGRGHLEHMAVVR